MYFPNRKIVARRRSFFQGELGLDGVVWYLATNKWRMPVTFPMNADPRLQHDEKSEAYGWNMQPLENTTALICSRKKNIHLHLDYIFSCWNQDYAYVPFMPCISSVNPQSHLIYNASSPRFHDPLAKTLQWWLESLYENFVGRCRLGRSHCHPLYCHKPNWLRHLRIRKEQRHRPLNYLCIHSEKRRKRSSFKRNLGKPEFSSRCFNSYWFNWCSLGHTQLQWRLLQGFPGRFLCHG